MMLKSEFARNSKREVAPQFIPCKANRKEPFPYDRHLYKARHLMENFFARLKENRAIATGDERSCS